MNLNLTLIGQAITFGIFIWFTMKYVWPPMTKALEERQHKIAEGLAAAERGQASLVAAQADIAKQIADAKAQSSDIITKANHQFNMILDEAKGKAQEEGQRILEKAKAEIDREINTAKEQLRQRVASLAIMSAEKILEKNIDQNAQNGLIDQFIAEL